MINLAFLKSKLFIATVCFLIFVGFTYRVYDIGYTSAVHKYSAQAIAAKEKHYEEIKEIEEEFSEMERKFLEDEAKYRIEFEESFKGTVKVVTEYVKDNGYTGCNIGPVGVQRVNDLLKGSTTED